MKEEKKTAIQTRTVAQFLNVPATQKFLEDNLKDRRGEFVSNLIALAENDAKLAECDPKALMMCAMNATALNLPLNKNLGFAYVIAYKGVPSFQMGYKGWIQLAIRTGAYRFLNTCEIREGEITRNKITGETTFVRENPTGKVVGYLAYMELLSGFSASLYMTEEEIESHALRYSQAYRYDKTSKGSGSKWSDPEERPKMAKKTVLKGLLSHYGLVTTEIQRAFEADNESENPSSQRGFDDAVVVPQEETPKKVQI